MPQQDMFDPPNAFVIEWRYSINPKHPENPPTFSVQVKNAKEQTIEYGIVVKVTNLLFEEVSALLDETWCAYLFGERGDVTKAAAGVHRRFKDAEKTTKR